METKYSTVLSFKVAYRLKGVTQDKDDGFIENHVVVEAYDHGIKSLSTEHTLVVVNKIKCDAMRFFISNTGNVTVSSMCSININQKVLNVLIHKNDSLKCTVQANVDVQYQWLKDGHVSSGWSDNGELILTKVQHGNSGLYACRATSTSGLIQSAPTMVNVQGTVAYLLILTNFLV